MAVKTISISMDERTYRQAKAAAELAGLPMSAWMSRSAKEKVQRDAAATVAELDRGHGARLGGLGRSERARLSQPGGGEGRCVNRGDVFAHQGLGRAGYVVIVSNDGFSAITGHPVVVRVSDRPDLTETPYVVALTSADQVSGHLESYSVVRLRRDRLGPDPVGRVSAGTLRKLDDSLALLFDYGG